MGYSTYSLNARRGTNLSAALSLAFLISCGSSGSNGGTGKRGADGGSGAPGSGGSGQAGAGGRVVSSGGTGGTSGSGAGAGSGTTGSGGTSGTTGSGGTSGPGGTSGSGGTMGSGGSNAGGKGGSGGTVTGTAPTMLPMVSGTCPTLTTGESTINLGVNWTVWVGANKPTGAGGPIVIYWHSAGADGHEALTALSPAVVQEIQDMGGLVAAPIDSSKTGGDTGAGYWFTGDVNYADQLVACAIQQRHIDVSHIHVAGFYMGGGLQTAYMWAARSGYVASVVSLSGGQPLSVGMTLQDPSHVPAAMDAHGAQGKDTFIQYDMVTGSTNWQSIAKPAGGFFIDCNDGGGIDLALRATIAPQAWQFMKDHPFGVKPEPYTVLPSGWPSYCTIK